MTNYLLIKIKIKISNLYLDLTNIHTIGRDVVIVNRARLIKLYSVHKAVGLSF